MKAFFVIGVIFMLLAPQALACERPNFDDLINTEKGHQYLDRTIIFEGEIESIKTVENVKFPFARISFRVTVIYRGLPPSTKFVTIENFFGTFLGNQCLAKNSKKGDVWLIFAHHYQHAPELFTMLTDPSVPLEEASPDILNFLKKFEK